MEPFVQSTTLNEELKNPHLVETLIRVAPSTGKRIQTADLNNIVNVLNEKMTGKIPEFDVNFNVQGIPLILSKQSHLEIKLTPVFAENVYVLKKWNNFPFYFEYNRALWPRTNAACISNASATFSNFSIESPIPHLLPHIKYNQMSDDLRTNNSRNWNPSSISIKGNEYCYSNKYINSSGTGAFFQPIHSSPYGAYLRSSDALENYFDWFGNPLLVQIPLEDILPVFQVPVIPLRQTNTSNINIRIRLKSPRHMFYSSLFFNPASAASVMYQSQDHPLRIQGIDTLILENILTTVHYEDGVDIEDKVVGGGTLAWLKAVTSRPFMYFTNLNGFKIDFNVDCELVLHALTTPLLNPLAQRYIEPFIDESNQFVAKFADYYTYSQALNIGNPTRFSFSPSQLFYNTTHVALFFIQDINPQPGDYSNQLKCVSPDLKVGNLNSLFSHGHFLTHNDFLIKDFQILLGSSCTPLFDRPLSLEDMMVATEEAMKKYNPLEMFGNEMINQNRMQEGNSFFLFDLTHARNSGFFIDADNMIRVEGRIETKEKLKNINMARGPDAVIQGLPAIYTEPPAVRAFPNNPSIVHVILMLIFQNTFTVILDLDGAVLFQQQ